MLDEIFEKWYTIVEVNYERKIFGNGNVLRRVFGGD